jgi:hypothetical protein
MKHEDQRNLEFSEGLDDAGGSDSAGVLQFVCVDSSCSSKTLSKERGSAFICKGVDVAIDSEQPSGFSHSETQET